MATTAGDHDAAAPRLRTDPDFRRYAAARITSTIGSVVTFVAMPVLIYQLTDSNFWTALVVVAEGVPYLCLGLFAGALADRIDRRAMMVWSDLINAALLISIPIADIAGGLTPPHVLAVAFATQAGFVFFDAANFGALPQLAGPERLAAAQSVVMGASTGIESVAPGLVGAALAVATPSSLLVIDAASFVGSALLIRSITRPLWNAARTAGLRRRLREDIRAGLGFVWRHPIVRIQTVVGFTVTFAGGAFVGQMVPWADQVLGVAPGDWRLGGFFSAWAVGAVLASVLFPFLSRAIGEPRVTLVVMPVFAIAYVGCAQASHWLIALPALTGWGAVYMLLVLNSLTLRQRVTPEHLLSRVNTTGRMLSYGLGYPGGALAAGVISEAYGPRVGLLAVSVVPALGAVAAWLSPLRSDRGQWGPPSPRGPQAGQETGHSSAEHA